MTLTAKDFAEHSAGWHVATVRKSDLDPVFDEVVLTRADGFVAGTVLRGSLDDSIAYLESRAYDPIEGGSLETAWPEPREPHVDEPVSPVDPSPESTQAEQPVLEEPAPAPTRSRVSA